MFTNVPDDKRICYEGNSNTKIYCVTLTSRQAYNTPLEFREALYEWLSSIQWTKSVIAVMERHNQIGKTDKIHAHGYVYSGNPPKGNRTNPFYFKVNKCRDVDGWNVYCSKGI